MGHVEKDGKIWFVVEWTSAHAYITAVSYFRSPSLEDRRAYFAEPREQEQKQPARQLERCILTTIAVHIGFSHHAFPFPCSSLVLLGNSNVLRRGLLPLALVLCEKARLFATFTLRLFRTTDTTSPLLNCKGYRFIFQSTFSRRRRRHSMTQMCV